MRYAFPLMALMLASTVASFAGIKVDYPTNGVVTNSPLHVVAWATPNTPGTSIAAVQIYIDGGLVYQSTQPAVDTYLNVGAGQHQVAVQAWDTAGQSFVTPVNFVGTGTGVFLTSPGANATVNGSVRVVASAASQQQITAMQVYDNGNLVNQVGGAALDTTLNLTPGSHYLAVQAWDASGATYLNPVTVNVPGADTNAAATDAPQANIPGGAIQKLNIDELPGWESCDACAGLYGAGPIDPYSMTQYLSTPSMDGKSATFWLGGQVPWGAALWWKQLGPNDGLTHFVYDLQFYVPNPTVAQGLEFDVNHSNGPLKYIFGTECDARTNGGWRIWDTLHANWVQTQNTCTVNPSSWNHLTWEFEQVGNQTHYIAVTLNGYRQIVDKYFWAMPVNAHEVNVAFQLDGDEHQDNYQAWLDKVNLYTW